MVSFDSVFLRKPAGPPNVSAYFWTRLNAWAEVPSQANPRNGAPLALQAPGDARAPT
jgi:hypothetical protein